MKLSARDYFAAFDKMLLLFRRLIPSVTLPVISIESILFRITERDNCSGMSLLD